MRRTLTFPGWFLVLAGCGALVPSSPQGLSSTGGAGGSTSSGGDGGAGGASGTGGSHLTLTEVATYSQPISLSAVPGHDEVLLVGQTDGEILWQNVVSGASGTVGRLDPPPHGTGQDLFSLTFAPGFPGDPRLLALYTMHDGTDVIRIVELSLSSGDPLGTIQAQKPLLDIPVQLDAHVGGSLVIGADSMLYASIGDGGAEPSRPGDGQNPADLYGKVLRLDVSTPGSYRVPADNPFAGMTGHAPEVYALGFRNPFRMGLGPGGILVVADVGESAWEEVDLVEKGGNYGWNKMEGPDCYPASSACAPSAFRMPIYWYPHPPPVGGTVSHASITGGAVYTGNRLPEIAGQYVFGDWATGILRAVPLTPGATARVLGHSSMQLVAFVQAPAGGDMYLADLKYGEVYRLDDVDPQ